MSWVLAMKKKVLIVVNSAKSIIQFRLLFLQELLRRGYEIILCAPIDHNAFAELQKCNITPIEIKLSRKGINIFVELRAFFEIHRIIRELKPNICIFYTIKPVIYGSLIAQMTKTENIFSMIPGLGYVFVENRLKNKILRFIVCWLYKKALRCNKKVFFLNRDDITYFVEKKIVAQKQAYLTNGEGVDLKHYFFSPFKVDTIAFLFSSRLLKHKGLYEYVEAARIIKKKHPGVIFLLAGKIDDNPAAIKISELDQWVSEGVVRYFGYLSDVREVLRKSAVFVLPSYYREGLPSSVVEAMAVGRPIITTDSPGCRETVLDGVNGFLVPVRDVASLVAAMERFILHPELIVTMGLESRHIAEAKYDVHKINGVILKEMELENMYVRRYNSTL